MKLCELRTRYQGRSERTTKAEFKRALGDAGTTHRWPKNRLLGFWSEQNVIATKEARGAAF
jgi:hypothetical protein